MSKEWTLITGASSGIGAATAMRLATRGTNLILLARRKNRLQEVLENCLAAGAGEVRMVLGDVNDQKCIDACQASLGSDLLSCAVLNAGFAFGREPFQNSDPKALSCVLQTNTDAVFHWSHWIVNRFLTQNRQGFQLKNRSGGDLVVMGSVAGHFSYACGHVYAASKAAIASFVQGLRRDLHNTGIRIMEIAPGMVETEFSLVRFQGDQERAQAIYEGKSPLHADDIADAVDWVISRPARVNFQTLLVFPTSQSGV